MIQDPMMNPLATTPEDNDDLPNFIKLILFIIGLYIFIRILLWK